MSKRKCIDDFPQNLDFEENPVKRCKYENCVRRARYGYKDECATHCRFHKLRTHVDIKHRHDMCIAKGCYKRAYFGPKNQRPNYCTKHRSDSDVYRSAPMCCEEGCFSLAIYGNLIRSHIPQHCKEHKKDDESDLGKSMSLRGKTKEEMHRYFFPKKTKKYDEIDAIEALISLQTTTTSE